jgi:hypothetical protein
VVSIFTAEQRLSGHTLKHVFASLAPAIIIYDLTRRRCHAARPRHFMD